MLWLKACPRCNGDLLAERDLDGAHVACLQCGREAHSAEFDTVKAALARRARRTVAERPREYGSARLAAEPVAALSAKN